MTPTPALSRLDIVIQDHGQNYPTVRFLIDGEDRLDPQSNEDGNDPEHILHNGALLPQEPARRIAFYGCGCGTFGCFVIAGLIKQDAGVVTWTDFRTVTAAYDAALPEIDGPDPAYPPDAVDKSDDVWFDGPYHRHLKLPDIAFDAEHYHHVVEAAAADRSWENHTRAVLRHLKSNDPPLGSWTVPGANQIEFAQTTPGQRWGSIPVTLEVPPGPPADVASRLVDLHRRGTDYRDIARNNLWC